MKQGWTGIVLVLLGVALLGLALAIPGHATGASLSDQEQLGKFLFFDTNLSVNHTQSCATCHAPEVGYTGPDSAVNAAGAVYPGALGGRFGNRKPPAASYAGDSPLLTQDADGWLGGMFWDGRATGARLGDPLAEQAGGPYLNPLEMGMPSAKLLCLRVRESSYAGLFEQVYGKDALNCAKNVNAAYDNIMRAVAAFERSSEVNPFSSKFDAFWAAAKDKGLDVTKIRVVAREGGSGAAATATIDTTTGRITNVRVTASGSGYLVPPVVSFMGGGMGVTPATAQANVVNGQVVSITLLTAGSGYRMAPRVIITPVDPYLWQNYSGLGLDDAELQGLAAFNDPNRANCSSCHALTTTNQDGYPLFTDFRYDNIGMPKNPENPFYTVDLEWNPEGANWVDYGLGGYLKSAGYPADVYGPEMGKFKVPSLRNVDLRPSAETVKAYGHNGYFKSLETLVRFYSWRGMMDSGMGCGGMGGGGMGGGMNCSSMFPAPEVDANRATLKHFNMMDQMNIVTFLKTLSDGYK